MVALVNRARAAAGKPALAAHAGLTRAATDYCSLMVSRNELSHDLGGGFAARVALWEPRYNVKGVGAAGENIAEGQPTPAAVVAAWMASPGHKANILGDYTLTGVAVLRDSDGRAWWCQDFASHGSGELLTPGGVRRP